MQYQVQGERLVYAFEEKSELTHVDLLSIPHSEGKKQCFVSVVVVDDSHNQRSVLATEETTVTQ